MSMRIHVINLSSLRKQSGAEIESMIEHLEMREYFDMSFRAWAENLNRSFVEALTKSAVTSDFER